jgi:disulfide bond formation protein DsbB
MAISDLNYFLGLGTLLLNVVTVALLAVYVLRGREAFRDIAESVARRGLLLGFVAAFGAAAFNVYYSDILGVEACYWCWWQRIFLYPQAILFAMAMWKEKYAASAIDFSIVLSIIGAGIAIYHHALQMLPGSGLPCPAVGVSCSQRILFEFNYITYPWMALSVFAFLIVVLLLVRSRR